jgi:hypothetical protein
MIESNMTFEMTFNRQVQSASYSKLGTISFKRLM